MKMKHLGLCASLIITIGCNAASVSPAGGNDTKNGSATGPMGGNYSVGAPYGGGTGAGPTLVASGGGSVASLPPETESQVDFLAPRGGGRYVYVTNPTRDIIAIIDSKTLAIVEVTAGDAPTYLTTIPGQDVALVINVGSQTLNVLRGTTVGAPLSIVPGANSISVSPDGSHAVVWFDSSLPSKTGVVGSYQDVSVITLSPGKESATSMTVGFQPSAVVFSNDNAAAFVITSDGISALRFASITVPARAPLIRIQDVTVGGTDAGTVTADAGSSPLPADSGAPVDAGAAPDSGPLGDGGSSSEGGLPPDGGASPDLRAPSDSQSDLTPPAPTGSGKPVDVSVTRDGHYAIARRDGRSELLLVDLVAGTVTSTQLSSPITDLDIKDPEGVSASPQAFAVLRNESKLVRLDIPAGFTDSTHQKVWPAFVDETIGSVSISKKGTYAVLYTTAAPIKRLVIVELSDSADAQSTSVVLQKAIRAIAFSDDEKVALVLHTKADGSPTATGIDFATQLDRSYGYTLVSLQDGFPKLQVTSANPDPFTITPDSSKAFVLLRDDANGVRAAQRIALDSFLVDDFQLGSPPSSIAALSTDTRKVFIGQEHPEGRITFIDWLTGAVESVTGFDLNGRIQQ